LNENLERIVLTVEDSKNYTAIGNWNLQTVAKDKMGKFYYVNLKSASESALIKWNVYIPSNGLYSVKVFVPTLSFVETNVLHSVKHAFRVDQVSVNQRGSRWIHLGNFILKKGFHDNLIEISNQNSKYTVVNAVKIEKYPECNGIPGNIC
jgi:hypothetical protein